MNRLSYKYNNMKLIQYPKNIIYWPDINNLVNAYMFKLYIQDIFHEAKTNKNKFWLINLTGYDKLVNVTLYKWIIASGI